MYNSDSLMFLYSVDMVVALAYAILATCRENNCAVIDLEKVSAVRLQRRY